ncbi:MAG: InlB B-repeat-containing protein [Rhodocyclaceae bacterium]|jgi:uncharacterized repeat protein (TIGR02543 family)|nr:InlB B-repeat-containing protein [Rhodocyclaceae bacterium]
MASNIQMVMNMFLSTRTPKIRLAGFVLIEALIALLIVSLGILALSKLETLTLSAAGESRSRSEAVTLAQRKLEQLRQTAFTAPLTTGSQTCNGAVTLGNGSYTLCWTITDAGSERRLIQLSVQWTDRFGTSQTLTMNSAVAWDDPEIQVANSQGGAGGSLISPTGDALRGDYSVHTDGNGNPLGTATNDGQGTHIYTDGTRTLLLDSSGREILYLENNKQFTRIAGRVYFDQNAGNNAIPDSDDVVVRLSSEGQCFFDNVPQNLIAASGGSNSYKYFEYVCYVGPGWYGNVGITITDDVNGQAATPTICVGDPGFNNGVSNSTLTSAHPLESGYRSYRGFYNSSGTYLSNGMAGNRTYPNDGTIVPGTYANDANGQYNQHFLITHLSGNNSSCNSKMTGGIFTSNAGKYYCISPDNDTAHSDVCPNVWPGFESEVGNGGSINYTLTLTKSGSTAGGSVVSNPTGISCDTSCATTSGSFASGTAVTLTPTPAPGYTFDGWGGACTGTGSCAVTMSANTAVTATFTTGTTTHALTASVTGSGTVTSTDTYISCPGTCAYSYLSGANVTLTAAASPGYTFTGWGGACSGTGNCTVTMDAAKNVTATFALNPTLYTLSVGKSSQAGGTVTSSPTGISCGTGCASASSSYTAGTVVTLTATPASGYSFAGWSGACSGTGSCVVTMSAAKSVTANFGALCNTPISGTAHDKHGTVSVSPSSAGTCSMANGSANYSCALSTVSGTAVTLTNSKTNGNPTYSYTLGVTANCVAQTNVNFP